MKKEEAELLVSRLIGHAFLLTEYGAAKLHGPHNMKRIIEIKEEIISLLTQEPKSTPVSGKINWRNIENEEPEHDQKCLVKMKHGIMDGYYDSKNKTFSTYKFTDIDYYGHYWIPITEIEES
jgi:hypothetical protein